MHTAIAEPVFVNLLRSPGIDSRPGGIDSSELILGLLKHLQIRALSTTLYVLCMSCTMRPKAREMTQHGSPPGWLEDPAVLDLYCDIRSMPPSLTDRCLELFSCELLANPTAVADVLVLNVHKTPPSRKEGMGQKSKL